MGSSVPGFLEMAAEWEAQVHFVPSISEVRCHLAHVWLAVLKLGAPLSLQAAVHHIHFYF